ncbi:MAG: HAMP domain-containing protein [Ruminiclostridium sp.]|jgi:methyl-accepting chemotaxis protein|nr:HAMP domain-containing protein [Ruminiclostridium sp.]
MIKNMKIRKSLILGYGVTILISVIIIVAALLMMNNQKNAYTDIIDEHVRAKQLITDCRLESNIAARYLRDAVLSYNSETVNQSEINQLISDAAECMGNLDAAIKELAQVYPLSDTSILTSYTNLANAWEEVAKSISNQVSNGQITEAANSIVRECTPKLTAAADASRIVADALTQAQNDIISVQNRNSTLTIVAIIVAMAIGALIVVRIALIIIRSIVRPVAQVQDALQGFSEGKLDIPVDYESNSELGEMCVALRTSQHVLNGVIGDTCHLLEEMGEGNFDVRTKDEALYVGALNSILTSVRAINRGLSDALTQINQSAEQVSAGAEQVSTGAQSLAQGATEQASAVQELSATISEISNNSRKNAENSEKATNHANNASQSLNESSEYMQQMVAAMERISESSSEIGKIIDTIENIAFQTNILALNAAVEAARAGSAGKGFAVVADEVRNLASKSDQAAKATKDLIDRSINSVKDGNEIVQKVSAALQATSERAGLVMMSVQEITKAAEEESESIAQVTEGIDQISSVVQTNSATSEESAAASEELSSQAALMKELLARFKIRQDGYMPKISQPSSYSAPAAYDDMMEPASSVDTSASSVFSKY